MGLAGFHKENCFGWEGSLDVLEFLAHSEWPAVAAGTIWMLRQPLRSMFDRVTPTKVDVLGVKAEFERRLATAEALVPPSPAEIADETSDPKLNVVVTAASLAAAAVAEASPKELILGTWNAFEETIRSIVDGSGAPAPGTKRASPIRIDAAVEKLGLSNDEAKALIELRKMRNDVVHKSEVVVTPEDARRFGEVAARLVHRMVLGTGDGSAG